MSPPYAYCSKIKGRADRAVETLVGGGGRGSSGLGGLHGRDRGDCLGIVRVGHPGQETANWTWMPGLILTAIAWLYGKGR